MTQPTTPPEAKPTRPPKRRRLKRFLLGFLGLLLLTVLAFPWWSILLVKPIVARIDGASIEDVQQLSWKRWQLTDAAFSKDNLVDASVETIEIPSPSRWILAKLFGSLPIESVYLTEARVDLPASSAPANPDSPKTPLADLVDQARNAIDLLHQNISGIELDSLTLSQNARELLRIENLTTDATSLSASLAYLPQPHSGDLVLDFAQPSQIALKLDSELLTLALFLDHETDLILSGTASSQQNEVALSARWPSDATNPIPAQASVSSDALTFDNRYPFWKENPPIQLTLQSEWTGDAYSLLIQNTDTFPDSPTFRFAGNGTLQTLTLSEILVELPWLSIANDAPLAIDFRLEDPLENAELSIRADLSRIPWIEATGTLAARLTADSTRSEQPRLHADFLGSDIALYGTRFTEFEGKATAVSKNLDIHNLALVTEAGSTASVHGSIDFESQQIESLDASVLLKNESPLLRSLLQFDQWTSADASLSLSGPLKDPNFTTSLHAYDVKVARLKPLTVSADASGNLSAAKGSASAASGDNHIDLSFAFERTNDQISTTFPTFAVHSINGPTLSLPSPATLFVASDRSLRLDSFTLQSPSGNRLSIDRLHLAADELALRLAASSLRPTFFESWIEEPNLPSLHIVDLDTDISLTPEASLITTNGEMEWSLDQKNIIQASWRASQQTEQNGQLRIDHLEVGSQDKHILRAKGSFPLSLHWQNRALRHEFLDTAPIELSIKSAPHPDFWRSLESLLPIAITRPNINAQLSGTLREPNGHLELSLNSLLWKNADPAKNIRLSEIQASLHAENGLLAINALKAKAGNNTLEANATLPLENTPLATLLKERQLPSIDHLDGQASLTMQDMEAIAAWIPDFVRRQGSANINARFTDGELTANASLKDLASRPLPPLGSLSKLSGEIEYKNGKISTRSITGLAEQSAFSLKGSVDLSSPETPKFDLAFNSKEFPLIRDSGILFSGDIDLKLVSKSQTQPSLEGAIVLTKGLVLVEPELLTSNTKTTSQRPPYFSVEADPFKDWDLNINIKGDRFLRVSNAFFEGTLSADFSLEGSLGTPLLIGRGEAVSGTIRFPAASLRLTKGEALITRERPNEIQIDANAEGRLFAHDINLAATGELEDIDVTITTNPALSQVDALLLVTTGTVPNQGTNLAQQSATSLGIFIGKGLLRKLTGPGSGDGSSKLSLEIGNDISLQGKKTIEATYQLSEDLEVEGEYDERDEYNANFKWTFYRK